MHLTVYSKVCYHNSKLCTMMRLVQIFNRALCNISETIQHNKKIYNLALNKANIFDESYFVRKY